jgi:hypothetical protein
VLVYLEISENVKECYNEVIVRYELIELDVDEEKAFFYRRDFEINLLYFFFGIILDIGNGILGVKERFSWKRN